VGFNGLGIDSFGAFRMGSGTHCQRESRDVEKDSNAYFVVLLGSPLRTEGRLAQKQAETACVERIPVENVHYGFFKHINGGGSKGRVHFRVLREGGSTVGRAERFVIVTVLRTREIGERTGRDGQTNDRQRPFRNLSLFEAVARIAELAIVGNGPKARQYWMALHLPCFPHALQHGLLRRSAQTAR